MEKETPPKKTVTPVAPESICPNCLKSNSEKKNLCFCAEIKPDENTKFVLVLQHPQEPDKDLGTAKIATLSLSHSKLLIALSRPSLKKLLGVEDIQPSRWAVLYLGSGMKPTTKTPGLYFVSKSGAALPETDQKKIANDLEGLIFLDGTWSQAKALWWRNPWLLKCRRAVLIPTQKSLYGRLRKEPRPECLSTIETIAETLNFLGEDPAVAENLRTNFKKLLARNPKKS